MVSFEPVIRDDGIFIAPSSIPTTKDEALASLEALKFYEITKTPVRLDPVYINILEKLINS